VLGPRVGGSYLLLALKYADPLFSSLHNAHVTREVQKNTTIS
jgi:hypothetical protein